MEVHVLNRKEFELMLKSKYGDTLAIEKDINNCFISIHNYDQSMIEDNHINFLNLWFDDITDYDDDFNKKHYPSCQLFTEKQAELILDFCEENKNKNNLYVHCSAGISRSGAVGAFINDVYGTEYGWEFFRRHPMIHPNSFVSRTLSEGIRRRWNNEL